jgi:hypothetical protein
LLAAYDGRLNPDLPDAARPPTEYCASQLDLGHRNLLADLPLSTAMDVTGLEPVRFRHATTRSDTEIVLVDSPVERYRDAFADTDGPTVVPGHTHMPLDRLADRRRFVNPGSGGMPYGGRGAFWALLGPDVALRRTAYDANVAAETFRTVAPDYPGLAEFIEENVLTVPSDAEALAVFSRWTRRSDEAPGAEIMRQHRTSWRRHLKLANPTHWSRLVRRYCRSTKLCR